MLDNFGLGEFFFLAMLALLFFGPERLPQIGARLGRWVAGLTQYSKAFLTEWREEALAIHEAVEEVKGIRDEIVAARAELSGTLDTAREDLVEGVDVAKDALSGATLDVTQRIQAQQQEAASDLERLAREERGEVQPDGSGEGEAIEKTQQILASLKEKQEDAESKAGGDGADDKAEDQATPAPGEKDDEWERNRRAVDEIMARSKESEPSRPALHEPGEEQAEVEPATASPVIQGTTKQAAAEAEPQDEPEEPKESPFDRTQRIVEELRRKRSGEAAEEPAPVAQKDEESPVVPPQEQPAGEEEPASPKTATAFDRTQEILQGLMSRRSGTKAGEKAPASSEKGTALPHRAPEVAPDDFARLSAQVTELRVEMEALRKELQALRSAAGELPVEEAA